jgi:hypothetical protein
MNVGRRANITMILTKIIRFKMARLGYIDEEVD